MLLDIISYTQELHSVYHDGDHYSSKCVLQHDMESDIIMNSEPHPKDDNIIAVGIGHSNSILKIHGKGKETTFPVVRYIKLLSH